MTPRIRHLHEAPRRPSARSSRGERERAGSAGHPLHVEKRQPAQDVVPCPARPHPIAEPCPVLLLGLKVSQADSHLARPSRLSPRNW